MTDTSTFDERSYRDGVWVGQIIGAVSAGARSISSTWPRCALPEHREALEFWAKMNGLEARFDDHGVTIVERQPPKFEVVK